MKKSLQDMLAKMPITTGKDLEYARSTQAGPDEDAFWGVETPKRGRPKKGAIAAGTATKTIRQTPAFWARFEKAAKAANLSPHEAMRAALAEWATAHQRAAAPSSRKAEASKGSKKVARSAVVKPTARATGKAKRHEAA